MDVALRLLNGLLMLAAPLALGALLARRLRVQWSLYAAGAAGFFVSQILHVPFNLALLNPALERAGWQPGAGIPGGLLGPALLGLSAGAFEEPARYLVYRLVGRRGRTWSGGLMLGAGHGGLEAILLGAVVLYGFFQAVAYRGADLNQLLPPGQAAAAEANLNAYWSVPVHTALLGAVERILALCVQMGLSILVLQAVRRRNLLWLGLAIGWHMLVDGVALIALAAWGAWAAEGVIAVLALLSLGAIFGLRDREELPGESDRPDGGSLPPRSSATGAPSRLEERVSDSRYLDD